MDKLYRQSSASPRFVPGDTVDARGGGIVSSTTLATLRDSAEDHVTAGVLQHSTSSVYAPDDRWVVSNAFVFDVQTRIFERDEPVVSTIEQL